MPKKIHCSITDVIDHGERVYSVFMIPDVPAPRFNPGQFLHLALDPFSHGDFWPESRVFSIASSPEEHNLLRITYAVKGHFTARMESELKVGRKVWIKLPYGEFIIRSENDICLLAGGTGITAFTAFISSIPTHFHQRAYLFYGAKNSDLLIYRPLIDKIQEKCALLQATYLVEQSNEGNDYLPGRIDLDVIWQRIPDPLSISYYIAGPPDMIANFKDGLTRRGVDSKCIFIDAWE